MVSWYRRIVASEDKSPVLVVAALPLNSETSREATGRQPVSTGSAHQEQESPVLSVSSLPTHTGADREVDSSTGWRPVDRLPDNGLHRR